MKRGCTVIMANPPTGTGESNVPGLWPQTSRDGRARDGEFAFRGEIRILSFPSSGRLGGRHTARRLFAPRDGGEPAHKPVLVWGAAAWPGVEPLGQRGTHRSLMLQGWCRS
jgi:hypothetical protein